MQYFSTYQSFMVSAKSCDRCKRHADADDAEFHEFLTIDRQAGYGSVFGDGQQLKLDLCQHCVKTVLGDWMKILS